MSDTEQAARLQRLGRDIARRVELALADDYGKARQAVWHCEDGWVVIYTTTRVQGGKHHGNFLAQLFRPDGTQDDRRVCGTRDEAKTRATKWYRAHSPKFNKRHFAGRQP